MTLDKLQSRMDGASTTMAQNAEDIKTLESEVAEIDKAQAEATAMRTKEHEDYMQASKDFKDSAEAVAKAIEVLKNFYEGSFIQVKAQTTLKSKQPEFGGAKSDIASTIISVLEMSEEDFTTLLAECEGTEDEAARRTRHSLMRTRSPRLPKRLKLRAKPPKTKACLCSWNTTKKTTPP